MSREKSVKNFKKAVNEFDQTTRPVVQKILDLAQKGLAQAGAALQTAQANVDNIANAAIRVADTQADLVASDRSSSPHNKPQRGRARTTPR